MASNVLYKRAFVRGLNAELINTGALAYPTKEAADYAADYVADNLAFPDPATQGDKIQIKEAHFIGTALLRVAADVTRHLGGSTAFNKAASALTPEQTATNDVYTLLQKIASESEQPNDMQLAAQLTAAGAMDAAARPTGYAQIPMGGYEDKGVGHIGVEMPADRADRVEGSNSVVENSKAAAVNAWLKAAGVEGTYTGPANTLANAAKNNDAAALDQSQRPAGYAQVPVGGTSFHPSGSAIVGSETKVPPKHVAPGGTNSVNVTKTAALVAPFMHPEIAPAVKTAHVIAMSKLSSAKSQAKYLETMYLGFGVEKTAAAQVRENFLAFAKKAEEECDDDMEVAQAMNEVAEELEGAAADKAGGDPHKPDGMPAEAKDKEDRDVKEAALRNAVSRLNRAVTTR